MVMRVSGDQIPPAGRVPEPDPFTPDQTIPARADVVVVGGGIIGASTALFLAQHGVSTVLCEKGEIAGEQSNRNWGWVRKMGRDPRELPLMIEAARLWQQMDGMVEADTGFRQSGIAYLCRTEKDVAKKESWLADVKPYRLDSRIINGAELARVLPGGAQTWAGALYTKSDGCAEPQKVTPAIVRRARALGAQVFTSCAVRGLETAAGRISAVITEKGRIACNAAVFAGGVWSSLFCRNLGLKLPQLKVLSSVMRTAAFDGGLESAARGPGFAFRKRLDGGFTVADGGAIIAEIVPDSFRYLLDFLPALRMEWRDMRLRFGGRFLEEARFPKRWALDDITPFERIRVLDPAPVDSALRSAQGNLERAFPVFGGQAIRGRWAGMIDVTPDALPVISAVESLPGFFLATGFSGHGFGIGPGAGRLMADLVLGRPPVVDPTPFRYARFVDGSGARPYGGL